MSNYLQDTVLIPDEQGFDPNLVFVSKKPPLSLAGYFDDHAVREDDEPLYYFKGLRLSGATNVAGAKGLGINSFEDVMRYTSIHAAMRKAYGDDAKFLPATRDAFRESASVIKVETPMAVPAGSLLLRSFVPKADVSEEQFDAFEPEWFVMNPFEQARQGLLRGVMDWENDQFLGGLPIDSSDDKWKAFSEEHGYKGGNVGVMIAMQIEQHAEDTCIVKVLGLDLSVSSEPSLGFYF